MSVQIAITQIKEDSFQLKNEIQPIEDPMQMRFGIDFGFNINEEKQLFEIKTLITLNDEKHNEKLLDFKSSMTFLIDGMKEVYQKYDNGTFDFKNQLMEFLLQTNISTVRGMLVTRLQNTALNAFYIPIFDVKQMMEQMKNRSNNSVQGQ
ncbi:MAG: hypothetical protein Q4G27_00240 [Flavobacteriaceae bacterium]|nr:hypothetical protein [Flavobacteriaceae bacterium]